MTAPLLSPLRSPPPHPKHGMVAHISYSFIILILVSMLLPIRTNLSITMGSIIDIIN
ncbi:hypothetical protein BS78_01G377000 [Paspalum vaginatum]|nr:hypothetical protein BS78_01G377000 [Paspalum vaginatum]